MRFSFCRPVERPRFAWRRHSSGTLYSGDEHFRSADVDPTPEQGAQKRGQPYDEQPQVVSGGDQGGVIGIASGAREVIALEQAIGLRVPGDWFNGISPPQFAFDRG